MKVEASLKNYRRSARKVRAVAAVIRGLSVIEAENKLLAVPKASKREMLKLLKSAVANAKNNYKLEKEQLYISELRVDEGATLKRWRARAYGRAAQILKRSCHIKLVLEEQSKESQEKKQKKQRNKRKEKGPLTVEKLKREKATKDSKNESKGSKRKDKKGIQEKGREKEEEVQNKD